MTAMKSRQGQLFYLVIVVVLSLGGLFLWRPWADEPSLQAPGDGDVYYIQADPAEGFRWPYYLYVPKSARAKCREGEKIYLLILPNNTGEPSDDLDVHAQAARGKIDQYGDIPARLGTPLLIPIFPRPWEVYMERDLYVHALDRRTLQTERPELRRVDLQLLAMMEDVSARLGQQTCEVSERALMMGFSASGMFANRFTTLHPDRVLAAAVGSPGGWPIAPVAEWQGHELSYPLGVHDIEALTGSPFDLEAYRSVSQLLYIGEQDENDAVDAENRAYVAELFGDTPVERWPHAEKIYRSVGADVEFLIEPGVGHTIGSETWRYQIAFFEKAMVADQTRKE